MSIEIESMKIDLHSMATRYITTTEAIPGPPPLPGPGQQTSDHCDQEGERGRGRVTARCQAPGRGVVQHHCVHYVDIPANTMN